MDNNSIRLCGDLSEGLNYSHSVKGEHFYNGTLNVARLSDTFDFIPFTLSEKLIPNELNTGDRISVIGELRSYNRFIGSKTKLVLTVFCHSIKLSPFDDYKNEIELNAFLCKPPTYRQTPLGREITDMIVAVNRSFNRSDYIPTIAWGQNARISSLFDVGDNIFISGRLQSRKYQKKISDFEIEDRTAYEVSVNKLEKIE